ncbi:Hint domain-containing protein [Celeribacter sp. PS-C1]|uniref:Hint domain-containing protein n=1 Tax=Celeribacter sp. PS-C1 TaxID=2820813 RepID=UPI001C67A8F7|nr:Hint domain-containing protein [Celeribacter sp. PS-C1]MBW6418875.1 Hint domain-containing protein [Celeribacter sp. PS-C1]
MDPFATYGKTAGAALMNQDVSDHKHAASSYGLSGFGPGVMIETSEGPQPVEWLRPGDLLLTHDDGYQPLIWVGRSAVTDASFQPPLRIHAGAFRKRTPERDLILAPGHHLLLRSSQVELHFAENEVLVPSRDLATDTEIDYTPPVPEYAYCHLLLTDHQLLLTEGVWTESLFPDEATLSALGPSPAAEITAKLGPALIRARRARVTLAPGEAVVLQPRSAIAARRMAA